MSAFKRQTQTWKAAGSFGTVGLEVVLCILAGFLGGRWLDGKLGTEPYLAVVGFFLGAAAGGKAIYRGWREMQEITAREEREEGNPPPLDSAEEPPSRSERGPEPLDGEPAKDQDIVDDGKGQR